MEGDVAQNKTSACLIPMVNQQPLASTDRRTQIEISTIHRSGRKTGSSGLWENRDRRQE